MISVHGKISATINGRVDHIAKPSYRSLFRCSFSWLFSQDCGRTLRRLFNPRMFQMIVWLFLDRMLHCKRNMSLQSHVIAKDFFITIQTWVWMAIFTEQQTYQVWNRLHVTICPSIPVLFPLWNLAWLRLLWQISLKKQELIE